MGTNGDHSVTCSGVTFTFKTFPWPRNNTTIQKGQCPELVFSLWIHINSEQLIFSHFSHIKKNTSYEHLFIQRKENSDVELTSLSSQTDG